MISKVRILTWKKRPQIKLQRFRKVWICTFGWLVHRINSLYEVLKLEQSFLKNKVVHGKSPFFVYVHFVLPNLFALTLASDWAVLHENVAFSVWVLSTFLEKVFVFQKICFKVKVISKFPLVVTWKHADHWNGGLF